MAFAGFQFHMPPPSRRPRNDATRAGRATRISARISSARCGCVSPTLPYQRRPPSRIWPAKSGQSSTGSRHASCAQYSNTRPAPSSCADGSRAVGADAGRQRDPVAALDGRDRVELDAGEAADRRLHLRARACADTRRVACAAITSRRSAVSEIVLHSAHSTAARYRPARGRAPTPQEARPRAHRAVERAAGRVTGGAGAVRIPARGALQLEVPGRPRGEGLPTSSALLAAVVGTILLIAPSAYHRLRWREKNKERMLRTSEQVRDRRAGRDGGGDDRLGLPRHRCAAARAPRRRCCTVAARAAASPSRWFALPLSTPYDRWDDDATSTRRSL